MLNRLSFKGYDISNPQQVLKHKIMHLSINCIKKMKNMSDHKKNGIQPHLIKMAPLFDEN